MEDEKWFPRFAEIPGIKYEPPQTTRSDRFSFDRASLEPDELNAPLSDFVGVSIPTSRGIYRRIG